MFGIWLVVHPPLFAYAHAVLNAGLVSACQSSKMILKRLSLNSFLKGL